MPELKFEYSSNLSLSDEDIRHFLLNIHQVISSNIDTAIENCKSTICNQNTYIIGDGKSIHGFIMLNIEVLTGRNPEVLMQLGSEVLSLMKETFDKVVQEKRVQMGVHIVEKDRKKYFKYTFNEESE